jgi:hypothetical protein
MDPIQVRECRNVEPVCHDLFSLATGSGARSLVRHRLRFRRSLLVSRLLPDGNGGGGIEHGNYDTVPTFLCLLCAPAGTRLRKMGLAMVRASDVDRFMETVVIG